VVKSKLLEMMLRIQDRGAGAKAHHESPRIDRDFWRSVNFFGQDPTTIAASS
jgi:hypothetical protein